MDFRDSELQASFRQAARHYLGGAAHGGETAQLRSLAEQGWLGSVASPELGGMGVSLIDVAAIVEEIGRDGRQLPVAAGSAIAFALAGRPINGGARELFRELVGGQATFSYALAPLRDGDASIALADVGVRPDHAVVLLELDGAPVLSIVPLERAQVRAVNGVDRRDRFVASLGAALDDQTVLATGDNANAVWSELEAAAAGLDVVAVVGMSQRILEITVEYITGRVQFDVKVSSFQAARHRAVRLHGNWLSTRVAAYHGLWRLDQDHTDHVGVALARSWALRALPEIFSDAHLLNGGMGAVTEYPLSKLTLGLSSRASSGALMPDLVHQINAAIASGAPLIADSR